jgi:alpha-methylacyl-CoA racemase
LGPGPFAAMVLADMGADVLRVDRIPNPNAPSNNVPNDSVMRRGRRSIAIDTRRPEGAAVVLRLVERADVLIEGFRPGVAERMGVGPEPCLARNPRLVYGRMTGYGQDGPYAREAGHDINYIAISGALSLFGRAGEAPVPPANLLGDFGGGGMLLAFGVVCAVLEARRSGEGQVVDAAMVDGSALLTAAIHSMTASGSWQPQRGTNLLDTGAFFYDVYETSDGKYISVGAIEPQFYRAAIEGLGVANDPELPPQMDRAQWPKGRAIFAKAFRTKTRDEWCAIFAGSDACIAPVLSLQEAVDHPHNRARATFIEPGGITQPAPAPRFSRTPGQVAGPLARAGEHTDAILEECGFDATEIASLKAGGAIA